MLNTLNILFTVLESQRLWYYSFPKTRHLTQTSILSLKRTSTHYSVYDNDILQDLRFYSMSSFYQRFSICAFLLKAIMFYQLKRYWCSNCKHLDTLKNTIKKRLDANSVIGCFLSIVKLFNGQYSECAVNLFCKERLRRSCDWSYGCEGIHLVYCMCG